MGFFDPFGGSTGSGGTGMPGKDGRGIVSISFKSSTGGSIPNIQGAIDTYEILYTDNTKSTYTVKNGEKGDIGPQGSQGIQGEKGEKGDTGEQGPKGDKGDAAKAIIIETTLSANNWSSSTYTFLSEYIKDYNYINISIGKNITIEQYDAAARAKIICTEQASGQIVLKSLGNVPVIDIPISIVIEGEQIDVENTSIILTDDITGESYKIGINNGDVYNEKVVI